MKFLRSIFTALVAATGAKAASSKSPADAMREMRLMWLTTTPEKSSETKDDEIYVVVMDWPVDKTIVTVLCSSAGEASLYTTGSFGIVGGVGHESVRKAAMDFLKGTEPFLDLARATSDFSYPDSKTLRFFIKTKASVKVLTFPMTDVENPKSPARTLFALGQQVVTELRLITEKSK